MRACVGQDRLPLIAKAWYLTGGRLLLPALDTESDEPLESEYGTKFVAGPESAWLNAILRYRGVWERALSEFILRHVHDGDVCVDAGANCGYFCLLLAQRVGPSGKVIAIEAAPENVRAVARQPRAQRRRRHRRRCHGGVRQAEGRNHVARASAQ
jgi:hypothetical protein